MKTRHSLLALGAALGIAAPFLGAAHAQIVASWDFNDSPLGPPYANSVTPADPLAQTPGTDAAGNGLGYTGLLGDNATHTQFLGPGPSTGLSATNPTELQLNTFSFAFDFNPQFLGTFDNFIGKNGNAVSLDWQVHLLGDTGGFTAMEFVVRGETSGFAAATTGNIIALGGYDPLGNPQWTHVEGSYNATTGAITLSLSGAYNASVSTSGDTGLVSNAGGAVFLGTGGSGGFSTFAANSYIDNVVIAVPEPQTWGLIGLGLVAVLYRRRAGRIAC